MILLTGDIHGTNGFKKLHNLKKLNLTYNDYLVVLGDFGVIWHNLTSEYYDKNQEGLGWLKNNVDCKILFIDGNHENFDRLNVYPVSEWSGGRVHEINEQVIHLMRGQIFNIEGNSFFTMGGARSIDKPFRTEFLSWWKEEEPSGQEYDEGIVNLEKVDFNVDYILTHDAPSHIVKNFKYKGEDSINKYLEFLIVKYGISFKKWYFGHHHRDIRIKDFSCLYHTIEFLSGEVL